MIRVGIGGWVFAPWRGVFYPKGLPQARELEFASRKLTTIERGLGMLPLDQQRLFRACGGAPDRRGAHPYAGKAGAQRIGRAVAPRDGAPGVFRQRSRARPDRPRHVL
jgi:hypothetical protein